MRRLSIIKDMKKNYLFMFVIVLFISSCDSHDDEIVVIPPVVSHDMDINGQIVWSDDLLDFLTPVLSYTDAEGLHQIEVEDTMTVDEIWEIGGEVYDLQLQSWTYDITYAYTKGDTVRLNLKYRPKDHVEIIDTAVYTFDHQFNISQVTMTYNGVDVLNISNMGEKDAYEEQKCRGSEVRQLVDSLASYSYERKIFIRDNRLVVE